MNADEQKRRYLELMGRAALERQTAAARSLCRTCWRPRDDHHPRCPANKTKRDS